MFWDLVCRSLAVCAIAFAIKMLLQYDKSLRHRLMSGAAIPPKNFFIKFFLPQQPEIAVSLSCSKFDQFLPNLADTNSLSNSKKENHVDSILSKFTIIFTIIINQSFILVLPKSA